MFSSCGLAADLLRLIEPEHIRFSKRTTTANICKFHGATLPQHKFITREDIKKLFSYLDYIPEFRNLPQRFVIFTDKCREGLCYAWNEELELKLVPPKIPGLPVCHTGKSSTGAKFKYTLLASNPMNNGSTHDHKHHRLQEPGSCVLGEIDIFVLLSTLYHNMTLTSLNQGKSMDMSAQDVLHDIYKVTPQATRGCNMEI